VALNRKTRLQIEEVVSQTPGASLKVETGRKHVKLHITYKNRTRFVVQSSTPTCHHALKNSLALVRKTVEQLKKMEDK
jgi:hypothetical protein